MKEEDIYRNVNPYQKAISNEDSRDINEIEQMINWSICSNKIRYVDSCMNETPRLTIRPLEEKKHQRLFSTLEIKEDQTPGMIFEENKIKEAYFVRYEGVQSEISQVTRFDESTDLSTTYLGRINQTRKSVIVKVQNRCTGWYRICCCLLIICSPVVIPRQLRFSLYSGAVITEGLM